MITKTVTYQAGGETCIGYLAYHDDGKKKPLVMVVHAFEGCNDFAKGYAEKLAELGYVGFAIDMYGQGQLGHDLETCMAHAMKLFNNRQLVRDRILDTLAFATTLDMVDSGNIAAMGFCLGGLCCLDLARAGANVKGVASLHGALVAPDLEQKTTAAKVLVLHGYDDPQVPHDQIGALMTEMKGADVQFMLYSNTKHAYTDPEAHKIGPPEMGREYNALTTQRAWQACQSFFEECFQ